MGQRDLPLPSSSLAPQGVAEDLGRGMQSHLGVPEGALLNVVDISHGHVGGASLQPASLPFSLGELVGGTIPELPGPPGGSGTFGELFSNSLTGQNLDENDIDFLTKHVSGGTSKGYAYAFKHFVNFCSKKNVCPHTCPPSIIVKYLRQKFDCGASYSTINYTRSAISKFHHGFYGKQISEHPLVSQAVQSVFRQRPPLPRYKSTFDISPVLDYVASLQPLESLDLKTLTLKTFFLVTNSSLSRVSSVSKLRCEVEMCKVMISNYCMNTYLTFSGWCNSTFV